MSGLLLSACLAFGGPNPALVAPPATTVAADRGGDGDRARLSKGQRLVLGAGIAYGVGAGLQWATAAGGGALGNPGLRNNADMRVGYALGMVMGGAGQLEGVLLGGFGGKQLGRDSDGKQHLSRPLRGTGGTLLALGGATIVGNAMMWPTIRDRCRAGVACNLAGIHVGSAAMTAGATMLAYGNAVRPSDRRRARLPKKSATPLAVGGFLLAQGYLGASLIGMLGWQQDRDTGAALRIRNRLLVPVAGPWIVAAGPDAPLPLALVTAGLGAMQVGGLVAMGVGAGRAIRHRGRAQITVVPNGTGLSVVGRF